MTPWKQSKSNQGISWTNSESGLLKPMCQNNIRKDEGSNISCRYSSVCTQNGVAWDVTRVADSLPYVRSFSHCGLAEQGLNNSVGGKCSKSENFQSVAEVTPSSDVVKNALELEITTLRRVVKDICSNIIRKLKIFSNETERQGDDLSHPINTSLTEGVQVCSTECKRFCNTLEEQVLDAIHRLAFGFTAKVEELKTLMVENQRLQDELKATREELHSVKEERDLLLTEMEELVREFPVTSKFENEETRQVHRQQLKTDELSGDLASPDELRIEQSSAAEEHMQTSDSISWTKIQSIKIQRQNASQPKTYAFNLSADGLRKGKQRLSFEEWEHHVKPGSDRLYPSVASSIHTTDHAKFLAKLQGRYAAGVYHRVFYNSKSTTVDSYFEDRIGADSTFLRKIRDIIRI